MPRVSPEEGARKLIQNAKAAVQHVQQQVAKVNVAPTQKAASKVDKMRARFLEAVDTGKVRRGLERVSLEDWKRAMIEKGVPRIAGGLDRAESKITEFNRQFYPYLDRVQSEINAMPDGTLEDSINRMVHNVRRLSEFKRE